MTENKKNSAEFYMPRYILAMLLFGIIFFTGMIVLLFYIARGSDNIYGYIFVLLIFGPFVILNIYAFLQVLKTRYVLLENELIVYSIKKAKKIPYKNIKNIKKTTKKLQHRNEKILIIKYNQKKVKIDLDYIVNSSKLVKLLKEKIPAEKWK